MPETSANNVLSELLHVKAKRVAEMDWLGMIWARHYLHSEHLLVSCKDGDSNYHCNVGHNKSSEIYEYGIRLYFTLSLKMTLVLL